MINASSRLGVGQVPVRVPWVSILCDKCYEFREFSAGLNYLCQIPTASSLTQKEHVRISQLHVFP
jgi:hypothetical protein